MMEQSYCNNVFINCPYDKDYLPLKRAIVFVVRMCGLNPLLVSFNLDGGMSRLDKIKQMISCSRYGIHDISRCKAKEKDEWYRMNMPFEMGLDFGYGFFSYGQDKKHFLVLTEFPYSQQPSLSDMAGNDPLCHNGNASVLINVVRDFFFSELPEEQKKLLKTKSQLNQLFQQFQTDLYVNFRSDETAISDMSDYEYLSEVDNFIKTL